MALKMTVTDNYENPTIDIVIPVYNAAEHFEQCLQSVVQNTDEWHNIWIFDDCSTDLQIEKLFTEYRKKFTNLFYRRSVKQKGFVGTVNWAIKETKNNLLILNSDCQVGPEWLARLIKAYNQLEQPGIICPLSNNATILTITSQPKEVVLESLVALNADLKPAKPIAIPVAVGFCMLVNRELIERVGDLDPIFSPGYGEEVDWSLRSLEAGFEIAAAPDVLVFHSGSKSFTNTEKVRFIKRKHEHLINTKWPFYSKMVRAWWKQNPLRDRIEQLDAKYRRSNRRLVVHLIHRIDSAGGTEIIARQLIAGLNKEFDHLVIYPEQDSGNQWSDAVDRRMSESVRFLSWNRQFATSKYYVQGSPADFHDYWVEWWLTTVLKNQKPDLIHVHHLYAWGTINPLEIAEQLNIPTLYSLHDFHLMCPDYNQIGPDLQPCGKDIIEISNDCASCLKPRTFVLGPKKEAEIEFYIASRRQSIRSQISKVSAFVSPSEYLCKRFLRAFGPALEPKIHLIPHVVSTAKGSKVRKQNADRLRCTMLGGFKHLKGIRVLIESALLLSDHIDFNIYGMPGDSFDLIEKLPENCRYRGGYAVENVSDVLNENDLVIIPSLFEETFSLVLSEAWAHDLPVIASRRGALADRVIDRENGWLFDPGDHKELANILLRLSCGKGKEEFNHVRQNIKKIKENYQGWISEYANLYNSICKKKTKSRSLLVDNENRRQPSYQANFKEFFPNKDEKRRKTKLDLQNLRSETPIMAILWCAGLADESSVLRSFKSALNCTGLDIWLLPEESDIPNSTKDDRVKVFNYCESNLIDLINSNNIEWLLVLTIGDVIESDSWHKMISENDQLKSCDAMIFDHDHCDRDGRRYAILARPPWDNALAQTSTDFDSFVLIPARSFKSSHFQTSGSVSEYLSDVKNKLIKSNVASSPLVLGSRLDINQKGSYIELRNQLIERDQRTSSGSNSSKIQIVIRKDSSMNLFDKTLNSIISYKNAEVFVISRCAPAYESRWPECWKWVDDWSQLGKAINRFDPVIVIRSGITLDPNIEIDQMITALQMFSASAVGFSLRSPDGELKSSILIYGNTAGPMHADRPWPGGDSTHIPRLQKVSAISGDAVIFDPIVFEEYLVSDCFSTYREYVKEIQKLPGSLLDCSIEVGEKHFFESYRSNDSFSRNEVPDHSHSLKISLDSACWEIDKQASAVLENPSQLPVVIAITPDKWASSQYRLRQPLQALEQAGLIAPPGIYTLSDDHLPQIHQITRLNPNVLVIHNIFTKQIIQLISSIKSQPKPPRVVFLQDDLITELPQYHPMYGLQTTDVLDRLKCIWELSDHTVFSTNRLRQNCEVKSASVIENSLLGDIWFTGGSDESKSTTLPLKVGWVGAQQHEGDLRLLRPVVEQTARFIDWIFFGMCPAYLLPFVKRYEKMVDFDQYPDRLRSLNLDLGVVPLADNEFNHCKSRLRLLEFGALGIPVMASDRTPYTEAPVRLMKDDPDDWIYQLRSYCENISTLRKEGHFLKSWVMNNHLFDVKKQDWIAALGLNS